MKIKQLDSATVGYFVGSEFYYFTGAENFLYEDGKKFMTELDLRI